MSTLLTLKGWIYPKVLLVDLTDNCGLYVIRQTSGDSFGLADEKDEAICLAGYAAAGKYAATTA